MTAAGSRCFHCGEPLPEGEALTVTVEGREEPVCCTGCQAVASTILGSGLDAFYRFRPEPAGQPEDLAAADARRYASFDKERVQEDFVYRAPDGNREASLLIEGLYCAACGWLIESSLDGAPGVAEIRVNPATGRALVRWDPQTTALSEIMAHMGRLGYRPHPVLAGSTETAGERERRSALRRLIVAGLGMMQAMMFAVALYSGDFHGMDAVYRDFLRGVSLLVATPVVIYAGLPIFLGAARDLRNLRPGMDVPVALAIGGAYVASLWATFTGGPEVYFDSVTMFTFFLLIARYVEMNARQRANATTDALSRLVPETAVRVRDGEEEDIPVRDVAVGDELLIRPGATVPADGIVVAGDGRLDESLLTGESQPRVRGVGGPVIGGSVNLGSALRMRVERTGQDTTVSHIGRLLRRAQSQRPRIARLADTVGRWFVSAVLVAAAVVFAAWWQIDPDRAFAVTLAMLVATCPCALALATPTALAAGTNKLAARGILVTRADALETLARVDHVVLDKTGTLTEGRLHVVSVEPCGELDGSRAMTLACALERESEHPLAGAFAGSRGVAAEDVEVTRCGVEGVVDGQRLRIGRPDWVAALAGRAAGAPDGTEPWIALGSESGLLARFRVADRVRPEARAAMENLRARGVAVEIASGDSPEAVAAVADEIGVSRWQARLDPEGKLERIRALQSGGATVLMVGDGINDGPVLAGADISAAVHQGTALAQSAAGMILLGARLDRLPEGLRIARGVRRVIRQNLVASACYNGAVLPLAALGLVQPWLAAVGMTLSSLIVVLNSRRLATGPRGKPGNVPSSSVDTEGQPA